MPDQTSLPSKPRRRRQKPRPNEKIVAARMSTALVAKIDVAAVIEHRSRSKMLIVLCERALAQLESVG